MPTSELFGAFQPSKAGLTLAAGVGALSAIVAGTLVVGDGHDVVTGSTPHGTITGVSPLEDRFPSGVSGVEFIPVMESGDALLASAPTTMSRFALNYTADDGGSGAFEDSETCAALTTTDGGVSVRYSAALMTLATRMVQADIASLQGRFAVEGDPPEFETLCFEIREKLCPNCAVAMNDAEWQVGGPTAHTATQDFLSTAPLSFSKAHFNANSATAWQGELPRGLLHGEGVSRLKFAVATTTLTADPCRNDPNDCIAPIGAGGLPEVMHTMPIALTYAMTTARTAHLPTAAKTSSAADQMWAYLYPKDATVDLSNPGANLAGVLNDGNRPMFGVVAAATRKFGTSALVWVDQGPNKAPAPMLITGIDVVDDAGADKLEACLAAADPTSLCEGDFPLTFSAIHAVAIFGKKPSTLAEWLRDAHGAALIDPEMTETESGELVMDAALQVLATEASFEIAAQVPVSLE